MPIGADLSARYTEEAVGGDHPTKARVIDRLALAALFPDGKIRAGRQPIECAGRLDYVNATTLAFKPALNSVHYPAIPNPVAGRHAPFIDGSSGEVYYEDLPWAGITATNAGLAARRVYAVFVRDDRGALRLEIDGAGTWTLDSATGLAHKTGDASRTLVGIAWTNANAQFVLSHDVGVRSFWNRAEYVAESTGVLAVTTSANWASIGTHEIMMWPGYDVVRQAAGGQGWVNSASAPGRLGLDMGLDLYNKTTQAYPEVEIIGSSSGEKDNFGMVRTRTYTGRIGRSFSVLVFRVTRPATLSVGNYLFQSVVWI